MEIIAQGVLRKMSANLDEAQNLNYFLNIGDEKIALNSLINQPINLKFNGQIICSNCKKKTKKSYAQGHCYPCMQKLASCDLCIMKPETCHYEQGTCKEPQWGLDNCFIDHYVYLSNTSGLKVGITRHTQIPTRWIDQGAIQGLPIIKVKNRLLSGLIEVEIAQYINDKTNWRTLLKEAGTPQDLTVLKDEMIEKIRPKIEDLKAKYGDDAIEILNNSTTHLNYPVEQYPTKITSFNFDKNPIVSGILKGIKGQYLIFDTGVINIRKFSSYDVSLEA